MMSDSAQSIPGAPPLRHEPERQRFVSAVDPRQAVLDYQLTGSTLRIEHTVVAPALRGQGLAAALVAAALALARREGWTVEPHCSYATAYIHRHPETQDLLA